MSILMILYVVIGILWFFVLLTLMEIMRRDKWPVVLEWRMICIGSWILGRCPRRFRDWLLRRMMWG